MKEVIIPAEAPPQPTMVNASQQELQPELVKEVITRLRASAEELQPTRASASQSFSQPRHHSKDKFYTYN